MRATKKTSGDNRILRYWVEIRELASGSVRKLPLTAVLKICLSRRKKNQPPLPNEELLHLRDGNGTLEAKTFDELRARLRQKYPDAAFERTLHYERDREAEERRDRATPSGAVRSRSSECVFVVLAFVRPVPPHVRS
jgi:hypothetical protein